MRAEVLTVDVETVADGKRSGRMQTDVFVFLVARENASSGVFESVQIRRDAVGHRGIVVEVVVVVAHEGSQKFAKVRLGRGHVHVRTTPNDGLHSYRRSVVVIVVVVVAVVLRHRLHGNPSDRTTTYRCGCC